MKLVITTSPNKPLKGIEVTDSSLVSNVLDEIKSMYPEEYSEDKMLIVDKSSKLTRIMTTDPVNLWFNGRIGDIYRITGNSTMRYRRVVPYRSTTRTKSRKSNPNKHSEATNKLYFKAHNSVIDMIRARQGLAEDQPSVIDKHRRSFDEVTKMFNDDTLEELNISTNKHFITNSRGQRIFVYYLSKTDDSPSSKGTKAFVKLANDICTEVTETYNSHPATRIKLEPPSISNVTSPQSKKFAEHVEIIVVYNNETNGAPVSSKLPHNSFIQFFPVQRLMMDITKHVDQPHFHLLNPQDKVDRKQIREIYALNGKLLDPSRKLSSYGFKDSVSLFYI